MKAARGRRSPRCFNDFARRNGLLKEKDKNFEGSDVREGLTLVLSCSIPEHLLQFEGQTKSKLGTSEAKSAVDAIVSEKLNFFLEENKETAFALVRKMIKASSAREAARKAQGGCAQGKGPQAKASGSFQENWPAPSRRMPAAKSFIWSRATLPAAVPKQGTRFQLSGHSAAAGKSAQYGKGQHCSSIEKNEELNTIVHALGAGIGAIFRAEDSNYHKVIIMTDADTDGAHIQTLLLTFFYRYMRGLIDQGMLYIALPPLYKLQKGKVMQYAWTDEELAELRRTFLERLYPSAIQGTGRDECRSAVGYDDESPDPLVDPGEHRRRGHRREARFRADGRQSRAAPGLDRKECLLYAGR